MTSFLDKFNGKMGPEAERAVANMDHFGKLVFKVMWAKAMRHEMPYWDYGYWRGRRREMAIIVQLCLGWRLARVRPIQRRMQARRLE